MLPLLFFLTKRCSMLDCLFDRVFGGNYGLNSFFCVVVEYDLFLTDFARPKLVMLWLISPSLTSMLRLELTPPAPTCKDLMVARVMLFEEFFPPPLIMGA